MEHLKISLKSSTKIDVSYNKIVTFYISDIYDALY